MQALVRKEMKKFPEIDLILMDGRRHTIYTIVEELRHLPENTVIMVGTWRVDMNEGYFMRNATYAMMEVTPTIPTFTPSSVSLGIGRSAECCPITGNWGWTWHWHPYRLIDIRRMSSSTFP